MPSDPNTAVKSNAPECDLKTLNLTLAISNDDDDDFQNPSQAIAITQNLILSSLKNPNSSKPLKPSNGPSRKKQKPLASNGKENRRIPQPQKLNNSRVSKVRKERKVVREERGNLSASIRSGSVEISKFKEGDGVEEEKSCILSSNESKLVDNRQTGEIDFKLSRVSNVLQENKAVGEEWTSLSAPLGSGSVEIIPNFVSNTCDSFDCDQLKPIAVKGDEGDEVKEEKSCLLTSTDSKLLEYWQTGEFDLNISRGCEDSRGVKEEISCLLASNDSKMVENLQIGDFDFKNFRGFEDTRGLKEEKGSYHVMLIESRLLGLRAKSDVSNVGDVSGDFEPGINEEKLCVSASTGSELVENWQTRKFDSKNFKETMGLKEEKGSYYSMSIESRLLESRAKCGSSNVGEGCGDFELGTQLNVLMDLCCEMGEEGGSNSGVFSLEGNDLVIVSAELQRDGLVECPLCGTDITGLSEQLRQVHTNDCLDKDGTPVAAIPIGEIKSSSPQQFVDVNPVLEWLRTLGLSRYEEAFVREEIDWETLQWLTEENLLNIGVVALGPRKKIVHALSELRQRNHYGQDREKNISNITTDENTKLSLPGNKLITEYFQGHAVHRNSACSLSKPLHGKEKTSKDSVRKRANPRSYVSRGKVRDIPHWCCIPGTPFLVDAFRFLRGDCSHWFLTHFHLDHYQGLTRNFCHGKIYCSSITAHLVNMKIGVPWDRLQILPLNQKITVAGVNLTCLDANHCPGSIIILFEPPNGKAVLHTGDFRFSSEMASSSVLQSCHVHTLILDTTYCNPQYDFPKQEAVIQFVIEAIQAEAFNPKTLFLIGTYTIGKERLFLEVARLLKKKIYVGAAKLRLLRCLGLPEEDMQWFTANEMESHIHVVPMWTIASFKRMKHISNQYSGRFNLIVAFSPTGWTFGKGKKKTPGRRWQQGTIIRYEVPYSEHCSFTELREFVQFISPEHIIPSVNNEGPESADAMTALLLSDP